MDIRMICMDLDGTALQEDRVSFSQRLQDALEEASRRKIAIIPVTGRQFNLLPPALTEKPGWLDLVVCCNGSQIRRFSTGEYLMQLCIPQKPLEELLALAERFGLPIEFSLGGTLHLTQQSLDKQQGDPVLDFHRDVILARHGKVVQSLAPYCAGQVEKVNLLQIPREQAAQVVRQMEKIQVSAVFSSETSMEITHVDATKGNALGSLGRMLDIPMDQVLALGDSGNDIPMLRVAGLGVAMGNAPREVKAAADVICPANDEDGAAIAIERYALT